MKNLKQYTFIIGLTIVINALIHYIIIRLYGNKILKIIHSYSDEYLINFIIKLIKYELLIGLIILSIISFIMILPKKSV